MCDKHDKKLADEALERVSRANCRAREALEKAENRIAKLEAEIAKLRAWKAEAIAVEMEWDAQAIASMLGGRLGASCRAVVAENVPRLIADRDAALARVEKAEAECKRLMLAAMGLLNGGEK